MNIITKALKWYWYDYSEWANQGDRFEIISIICMTVTALVFIIFSL